jgi:prepilin-type N-terminal cleavage/methylation domain-containing protein
MILALGNKRAASDRESLALATSGKTRVDIAFTLLELLVVIGIISVLLVAVVPAVNSLSKASGRKAAINNLLGAIEQARAVAIKDGRQTYLAFAAQPSNGNTTITDQAIIDRYFYHSYAIFEDDPADTTKPKIQVSPWKVLPTGISLRTEISFPTSNAAWTSTTFAFTPAGPGSTQSFPYLQFDSTGALISPNPSWSGPIPLQIFEGSVAGTYEHPTTKANKDETINISRMTGRAEYVP